MIRFFLFFLDGPEKAIHERAECFYRVLDEKGHMVTVVSAHDHKAAAGQIQGLGPDDTVTWLGSLDEDERTELFAEWERQAAEDAENAKHPHERERGIPAIMNPQGQCLLCTIQAATDELAVSLVASTNDRARLISEVSEGVAVVSDFLGSCSTFGSDEHVSAMKAWVDKLRGKSSPEDEAVAPFEWPPGYGDTPSVPCADEGVAVADALNGI